MTPGEPTVPVTTAPASDSQASPAGNGAESLSAECKRRFFVRKDITTLLKEVEGGSTNLKRNLGALDVTAIGIGSIIGAGIFVLSGVATAYYAGPSVILSFIIASLSCAFAALAYAELASMIPVSGSAYTYSYSTMGELVAWMIGWDLILEYAVGAVAVAIGWSGYFNGLLEAMGINLPERFVNDPMSGGIINVPAILITLLLTGILIVGVKESARLNMVMVVIKIAVIVLVICVGAFYFDNSNLHPFFPFGFAGTLSGAALVFFAYIGFDAVSTVAEETKNPQKDMPIGIIASLAITTVLYIAVSIVLIGMVAYDKLGVSDPFNVAFKLKGLTWIAGIISVGAIMGITSVLLVSLMAQPRILFSLSRDGLLPKVFSSVHSKFKTPHKSTIITGCIVAVAAGLLPIKMVAELTNIGTLFAFILVCGSVIILRKLEPERRRPFRCPAVPVIPILGIAFCLALMVSLPLITWLRFFLWMGVGLLIYANYGYKGSVLGKKSNTELASAESTRVDPPPAGASPAGSSPTGSPSPIDSYQTDLSARE